MGPLRGLSWFVALAGTACTLSSESLPAGDTDPMRVPVRSGGPDLHLRADAAEMQAFCARHAEASCSAMRSCCLDKGIGYDERGCHAVALNGCQAGIQAVWDGEAVFQPVAAECFDAQADLFAKCENVSLEERLARTSFVFGQCLAFRGRREPGEACRGHFDCAQANAHSAWTYCDGVCRVASLTPLGASCRLGEACVPGAYCRPRLPGAVHGMCEPTFELGQPCDPASDVGACGYAARCDAARHACVAADRLVGELCTAHDECISGRCESALGFRCASAQPEIGALGCGTSNHARTTSPSL